MLENFICLGPDGRLVCVAASADVFFSIKNIIEIPAGGRTFGRLRLRRQMRTAQLGSCGSNASTADLYSSNTKLLSTAM